ncbi:hypothetical protein C8Q80DRAFT_198677 [Daedaleopsis nitida]|nr:hypothetical protein C8Q80DRAFT_198677 [Daedaleopsis nitida]
MAQSNGIDLASLASSSSSQTSSLDSGVDGFTRSRAALINGLWFSSLICSLAAASISLMTKQWLNQYTSGIAGISPEIARLRQFRYDNLRKWKVAEIVMLLPILLQGALVLFLVGLILFLLTIDNNVAIMAIVLVALLISFIFVTTVLPTFMPDCSYQSPQAWAIFVVIQTLKKPARGLARWIATYANQIISPHADGALRRLSSKFAKRVVRRFSRFADKPNSHSWKARERVLIDDKDTSLDQGMLVGADRTFLDDNFLRNVVQPCLNAMPPSAATQCYYDIRAHRADRVVGGVLYFDENKSSRTESVATLTDITLSALAKTREEETSVEHTIYILQTLERLLVRTLPHTYCRFYHVLFSLLDDRDTGVSHLAFVILYQQLSRNLELSAQHTSAGCHDLGAVVSFMSNARKDGDIKHFLDACDLVISLATLPAVEFTEQSDVRRKRSCTCRTSSRHRSGRTIRGCFTPSRASRRTLSHSRSGARAF